MSNTSKCLLCEKPQRSRGLCQTHFAQFNRTKKRLTAEAAEELERASVAKGLIYPVSERHVENPFTQLAEKLAKQRKQNANDDAAVDANHEKLRKLRGKTKPSGSDDQATRPVSPPAKKPRRSRKGD